jgi:hypothetical protein
MVMKEEIKSRENAKLYNLYIYKNRIDELITNYTKEKRIKEYKQKGRNIPFLYRNIEYNF